MRDAVIDIKRVLRINPECQEGIQFMQELITDQSSDLALSEHRSNPHSLIMAALEAKDGEELTSSAMELSKRSMDSSYAKNLLKESYIDRLMGILFNRDELPAKLTDEQERAYRLSLAKCSYNIAKISSFAELLKFARFFDSAYLAGFSRMVEGQDGVLPFIIEIISSVYSEMNNEIKVKNQIEDFVLNLLHGVVKAHSSKLSGLALAGLNKILPSKSLATKIMKNFEFLLDLIKSAVIAKDGKAHLSVLLARLWESSTSESEAKSLISKVATTFDVLFDSDDLAEKTFSFHLLGSLFQINGEFGSGVMSHDGLLDRIVDCIEYESLEIQLATLEALSNACSVKKCRTAIAQTASDYLHMVIDGDDEKLRNAAAVIMTKISSTAKDPLMEKDKVNNDTNQGELLDMMISQVVKEDGESNAVANAVEGIAYLSSKGEYKEKICTNADFLKKISKLAQSGSASMQYGISAIYYNLMAFKRRQTEEEKQIQKLRELAKEKNPDVHDPLDDNPAVEKRIETLVNADVLVTLRELGKSSSENAQTNVAECLLFCATPAKFRGLMVQKGLVKTLLSFTKALPSKFNFVPIENKPPNTKLLSASQALAKMAISLDPHLAFRNTASSLVRPLSFLSQSESELQQFESMLALTNISSMNFDQNSSNQSIQARIYQGQGLKAMENALFSDNTMVRRAAMEGICNMMYYSETIDSYIESPNKLRIIIALCTEDDFETKRAASGALAIMSISPKACAKICEDKSGIDIAYQLINDKNVEILMRGLELLKNLSSNTNLLVKVRRSSGMSRLKSLTNNKDQMIAQNAVHVMLNFADNKQN